MRRGARGAKKAGKHPANGCQNPSQLTYKVMPTAYNDAFAPDPEQEYAPYFRLHDPDLLPHLQRVPCLVQDILPAATLVLLAAPPKSGKTALATALAWSVATGTPFAGREVERLGVLWLNFEESGLERAYALSGLPNAEGHKLVLGTPPPLDTKAGAEALRWAVGRHHPSLVVVDSLAACVERTNLSEASAARKLMTLFNRIVLMHPVSVLLIHHTDERALLPSQSLQLRAATGVTAILTSEPLPPADADPAAAKPQSPRARLLRLRYSGRGLGFDHRVHLVSENPRHYRAATSEDLVTPVPKAAPKARAAPPRTDANAESVLATLSGPESRLRVSLHDIVLATELPRPTVRHALDRLIAAGRAEIAENRNGTYFYRRTATSRTDLQHAAEDGPKRPEADPKDERSWDGDLKSDEIPVSTPRISLVR